LDPRALRPGGEAPPFSRRLARLQGSWSARVAHPPYQHVVTLEIKDPKQLRQNIASEELQRHLYQLYKLAEITQLISDRFACALGLFSVLTSRAGAAKRLRALDSGTSSLFL
jgi:hypothetical protein